MALFKRGSSDDANRQPKENNSDSSEGTSQENSRALTATAGISAPYTYTAQKSPIYTLGSQYPTGWIHTPTVSTSSTFSYPPTTTFTSTNKDLRGLDREKAELPIVAWKVASIGFSHGKYYFCPISTHHSYTAHEDAVCAHGINFTPGEPINENHMLQCQCGFYALVNKSDIESTMDRCVLTVELSGSVLVCENGYRATRQDVVKVEYQNRCYWCPDQPVGLTVPGDTVAPLRAICNDHKSDNFPSITIEKLSIMLDTEVVFTDDLF